jgi:NitT/TauT family transport system substrate-binding protein
MFCFSAKDNIKSLEDISETDRIAVVTSIGNNPQLAFMAACKDVFGSAGKFETNAVAMKTADMIAAITVTDDISVVLTSYTPLLNSENWILQNEIVDLNAYGKEYSLGACNVANSDFAAENPAIIEAYYAAERETVNFINEHPDEAAAILAKYWEGESIENIEQMLRDNPPKVEISESGYDKLASFMYEIGLLDHEPKKFSELPNYDTIPKTD